MSSEDVVRIPGLRGGRPAAIFTAVTGGVAEWFKAHDSKS